MVKNETISLGEVVNQAYSSNTIDERLIAKFLTKSVDELDKEFKANDKLYDNKFESLDKDIRAFYSGWIQDKRESRKFIEELIKIETESREKEKLLNTWFKINSEIDGFCLEKKEYLKNQEIKLVEEKARKEKRAFTVQIAKAAVPIAIKGILFGLGMIASANNISVIDNPVPKISKK